MSRWVVSVDLGQTVDPTAIAVLEVSTRRDAVNAQFTNPPGELAKAVQLDWFDSEHDRSLCYPRLPVRADLRHLERLPLRMAYPAQVAHLAALLRRAPLAVPRAALVVDQTGVGRPVVDILRRAGLRPIGVTITAGAGETRDYVAGCEEWKVAKLILVSHLQAGLNTGGLRIAASLSEARSLVEELGDFRANIGETGYARFGAREGAHDDLVLALALGYWWACRQYGGITVSTFHI
jgi:hypothetical protein